MIIVVLFVFGVIFGSFVNAWVWRLHEQAAIQGKVSKKAQKRRQELSVTKGRSMCPNCEHTLAAKDLVPVLSWMWLRGKCRYCGVRIPDSPLVELATGMLFAVSYAAWPAALEGAGLFQFAAWLGFLVAFMALAVYDLRWFILPDTIVFPLIGLAGVYVAVSALWLNDWLVAWNAVLAAAIIFGLFWLIFQVTQGRGIGGGDVKLAPVLGLLAGTPAKAFLIIFLASLLGTIGSVPFLLKGKRGMKAHIPFGPYLLLATVITVLWGQRFIDWYLRLFLL